MVEDWWRDLNWLALAAAASAALLLGAVALIAREIRARIAADAARQEERERFHAIMYNAPLLVSVKDPDERLMFINRALEEVIGTPLAAARGKTLREIERQEAAAMISALDREAINTKLPLQREISYPGPDGIRNTLAVKFPLLDKRGEVEALVSFTTDITEQRRAETWLKSITDHSPAAVSLKDIDGRFVFVNRALQQRSGLKESDLLGKRSGDVFPKEYADAQEALDRDVIAARAPIQREIMTRFPNAPRTFLFVKFPVFDAKGNIEAIGAIATDITAQKRVEEQLAHAQRMEAIGQLTGGIAHDFNNLLTVILGNSELLTEALRQDKRLRPLAQVTLDAAQRSTALTQRLLAFGRRQVLEPRPTDVNRLLDDMEELILRSIGSHIKVRFRQTEDLWCATVDPSQLETAILNLVVNSRDAMPDGGRLIIETGNAKLDEGYVNLNPGLSPGDYVMIAIADNGVGMPPDVVARAFQPFFTTKDVGKGTGLGLSMIYGFVKQSGGHVKIHSEAGHGTVVRLYLPRTEAPTLVPDLPQQARDGLPRGSETILLVEDDRLVRTHTERQLAALGYRVLTASDPADALKLVHATGQPDLLLTDLIMPGGKNGRELALHLRQRWPGLKVLYMSGYADDTMRGALGGNVEPVHFLAKPFRSRELAFKAREALDVEAPASAATGTDLSFSGSS